MQSSTFISKNSGEANIALHPLSQQIQNNVFKCTHICICCYPLRQQEGVDR